MIRISDRFSGQGMSRTVLLQDLFSLDPSFWNHPSMRRETAEERNFRFYQERIEQAGQLRLSFFKEVRI